MEKITTPVPLEIVERIEKAMPPEIAERIKAAIETQPSRCGFILLPRNYAKPAREPVFGSDEGDLTYRESIKKKRW
jgi:hypothetical protein